MHPTGVVAQIARRATFTPWGAPRRGASWGGSNIATPPDMKKTRHDGARPPRAFTPPGAASADTAHAPARRVWLHRREAPHPPSRLREARFGGRSKVGHLLPAFAGRRLEDTV